MSEQETNLDKLIISKVFGNQIIKEGDWCYTYLLALNRLLNKDYTAIIGLYRNVSLEEYNSVTELAPLYLACVATCNEPLIQDIESVVFRNKNSGAFRQEVLNFVRHGNFPFAEIKTRLEYTQN